VNSLDGRGYTILLPCVQRVGVRLIAEDYVGWKTVCGMYLEEESKSHTLLLTQACRSIRFVLVETVWVRCGSFRDVDCKCNILLGK
jgi:hypothetical protein